MRRLRRGIPVHLNRGTVVLAVAIVIGLFSAAHTVGPTWRHLNREYRTFHAYTPDERRDAANDHAGLATGLFEDPSAYIKRGDRVYVLAPPTPLEAVTTREEIERLGRYYLLPAIAAAGPGDATVVISYDADPDALPVHYIDQVAFPSGLVVSRIRNP